MSTEKGQKMTLKMSTGRNKIPLYFILRVVENIVRELLRHKSAAVSKMH